MEPFTTLSGIAAPLDEANVDTNQICPTRFNQVPRGDRFAEILFHDRRFDSSGAKKSDFVLNCPSYDRANILVSGRNFGCGSSRETAVYGLLAFGIRAVIAESFGDIFKNNAHMNGLLPIQLEPDQIRTMLAFLMANPGAVIGIDLPAQTVVTPAGHSFRFSIHPLVKRRMMQGLDEIALTKTYRDRIDAFEARHVADHFWLLQGPARGVERR